ncbi:3-keto-disaccharide hydrolase [Mongoliibacter ruber]|nr:DUF1080 domain-containing protein [Mongoliibacter ruber]
MKKIKSFKTISIALLIGIVGCVKNQDSEETYSKAELPEDNGFVSIFDGKTLDGWEGDADIWRVEDGFLVGELTPESNLESNTFLIWKGGEPENFELKTDFKITIDGNSGINYRSDRLENIPFALRGYQADIDGKNTYTGQNYEERKRTTLAYRGQGTTINPQEPPGEIRDFVEKNAWRGLELTEELGDRDSLRMLIRSEDWNQMHLVIEGNVLKHYVNGVLMSVVTDKDQINRETKGLLGLQVHVGPPMKVMFKNIELKSL